MSGNSQAVRRAPWAAAESLQDHQISDVALPPSGPSAKAAGHRGSPNLRATASAIQGFRAIRVGGQIG